MVGLSFWCGCVECDWFVSVTVVQIAKALTKKGRKYDAVYDLGARNTIKAPQFFGRGVRVPTISLVEIRHQSYFQVKAVRPNS
jgi:hypothetical protein